MKKLKTFVLLFFTVLILPDGNSLLAQSGDYLQFDFESSIWQETFYVFSVFYREEYQYFTQDQTEINGEIYYQLWKRGRSTQDEAIWVPINNYAGAIRQNENRQVFYVRPGETEEHLLYDFNLELGDTIPVYNEDDLGDLQGVIIGVDTVEVCGLDRKRYEIELIDFPLLRPLYWTESIGGSHGPIPRYEFFESGISDRCFSDSNCAPCALENITQPVNRRYCYSYYGAEGQVFTASLSQIGDTVIQGRLCAVMDYPFQYDIRYLWYDQGQIYRYSVEEDSFFLLYDFDLLPGEILTVDLGFRPEELGAEQTCAEFLINDVNYEMINGEVLRVQHIEPVWESPCGFPMQFGPRLIERIGSDGYFVPYASGDEIWAKLDEVTFVDGGSFATNACIGSATTGKASEAPLLEVFPNPTKDAFQINWREEKASVASDLRLTVYNLLGEEVLTRTYQLGDWVQIQHLNKGVYLAVLTKSMEVVGQCTWVKQ